MIREEIRELKTGIRELRNFGLLVGAVLVALGLLFLLRGKARYPYFIAPGILLLLFGAVFPRAFNRASRGPPRARGRRDPRARQMNSGSRHRYRQGVSPL